MMSNASNIIGSAHGNREIARLEESNYLSNGALISWSADEGDDSKIRKKSSNIFIYFCTTRSQLGDDEIIIPVGIMK